MQAATVHRVAGRLGIVACAHQPLMTLVVPLVMESVNSGGCLNAYRTDAERIDDLQEFRDAVELIAADFLPDDRHYSDGGGATDV